MYPDTHPGPILCYLGGRGRDVSVPRVRHLFSRAGSSVVSRVASSIGPKTSWMGAPVKRMPLPRALPGAVFTDPIRGRNTYPLGKYSVNKIKEGRFKNLTSVKMPLMVGTPIISHDAETSPADRLFALNGTTENVTPGENSGKDPVTFSDYFRKCFGDSKVVDGNGEPLVSIAGRSATCCPKNPGRP